MAVPVRQTGGERRLDTWEPFGNGLDPAAELQVLTERFSQLLDQLSAGWPADLGLPSPLGELEETDDGVWSIYLGTVLLARLDERDYVIRG